MDRKVEAYASKVARANLTAASPNVCRHEVAASGGVRANSISVQQNIVATISQTMILRIGSTQSLG